MVKTKQLFIPQKMFENDSSTENKNVNGMDNFKTFETLIGGKSNDFFDGFKKIQKSSGDAMVANDRNVKSISDKLDTVILFLKKIETNSANLLSHTKMISPIDAKIIELNKQKDRLQKLEQLQIEIRKQGSFYDAVNSKEFAEIVKENNITNKKELVELVNRERKQISGQIDKDRENEGALATTQKYRQEDLSRLSKQREFGKGAFGSFFDQLKENLTFVERDLKLKQLDSPDSKETKDAINAHKNRMLKLNVGIKGILPMVAGAGGLAATGTLLPFIAGATAIASNAPLLLAIPPLLSALKPLGRNLLKFSPLVDTIRNSSIVQMFQGKSFGQRVAEKLQAKDEEQQSNIAKRLNVSMNLLNQISRSATQTPNFKTMTPQDKMIALTGRIVDISRYQLEYLITIASGMQFKNPFRNLTIKQPSIGERVGAMFDSVPILAGVIKTLGWFGTKVDAKDDTTEKNRGFLGGIKDTIVKPFFKQEVDTEGALKKFKKTDEEMRLDTQTQIMLDIKFNTASAAAKLEVASEVLKLQYQFSTGKQVDFKERSVSREIVDRGIIRDETKHNEFKLFERELMKIELKDSGKFGLIGNFMNKKKDKIVEDQLNDFENSGGFSQTEKQKEYMKEMTDMMMNNKKNDYKSKNWWKFSLTGPRTTQGYAYDENYSARDREIIDEYMNNLNSGSNGQRGSGQGNIPMGAVEEAAAGERGILSRLAGGAASLGLRGAAGVARGAASLGSMADSRYTGGRIGAASEAVATTTAELINNLRDRFTAAPETIAGAIDERNNTSSTGVITDEQKARNILQAQNEEIEKYEKENNAENLYLKEVEKFEEEIKRVRSERDAMQDRFDRDTTLNIEDRGRLLLEILARENEENERKRELRQYQLSSDERQAEFQRLIDDQLEKINEKYDSLIDDELKRQNRSRDGRQIEFFDKFDEFFDAFREGSANIKQDVTIGYFDKFTEILTKISEKLSGNILDISRDTIVSVLNNISNNLYVIANRQNALAQSMSGGGSAANDSGINQSYNDRVPEAAFTGGQGELMYNEHFIPGKVNPESFEIAKFGQNGGKSIEYSVQSNANSKIALSDLFDTVIQTTMNEFIMTFNNSSFMNKLEAIYQVLATDISETLQGMKGPLQRMSPDDRKQRVINSIKAKGFMGAINMMMGESIDEVLKTRVGKKVRDIGGKDPYQIIHKADDAIAKAGTSIRDKLTNQRTLRLEDEREQNDDVTAENTTGLLEHASESIDLNRRMLGVMEEIASNSDDNDNNKKGIMSKLGGALVGATGGVIKGLASLGGRAVTGLLGGILGGVIGTATNVLSKSIKGLYNGLTGKNNSDDRDSRRRDGRERGANIGDNMSGNIPDGNRDGRNRRDVPGKESFKSMAGKTGMVGLLAYGVYELLSDVIEETVSGFKEEGIAGAITGAVKGMFKVDGSGEFSGILASTGKYAVIGAGIATLIPIPIVNWIVGGLVGGAVGGVLSWLSSMDLSGISDSIKSSGVYTMLSDGIGFIANGITNTFNGYLEFIKSPISKTKELIDSFTMPEFSILTDSITMVGDFSSWLLTPIIGIKDWIGIKLKDAFGFELPDFNPKAMISTFFDVVGRPFSNLMKIFDNIDLKEIEMKLFDTIVGRNNDSLFASSIKRVWNPYAEMEHQSKINSARNIAKNTNYNLLDDKTLDSRIGSTITQSASVFGGFTENIIKGQEKTNELLMFEKSLKQKDTGSIVDILHETQKQIDSGSISNDDIDFIKKKRDILAATFANRTEFADGNKIQTATPNQPLMLRSNTEGVYLKDTKLKEDGKPKEFGFFDIFGEKEAETFVPKNLLDTFKNQDEKGEPISDKQIEKIKAIMPTESAGDSGEGVNKMRADINPDEVKAAPKADKTQQSKYGSYAGLRLKHSDGSIITDGRSGQAISGGSAHKGTIALGHKIQEYMDKNHPGLLTRFTAFRDLYHENKSYKGRNIHKEGLGIDATIADASKSAMFEQVIKKVGANYGVDVSTLNEYIRHTKYKTAPHMHINFKSNNDAQKFWNNMFGENGESDNLSENKNATGNDAKTNLPLPPQGKSSYSKEEVQSIILNTADKYDDISKAHLWTMGLIESAFDHKVKNSLGYAGVYQFGTRKPKGGGASIAESFGLHGDDVYDPFKNTEAAIKMMRSNRKYVRKHGLPEEDWIDYLAHQQGLGGARFLWEAAKGDERGLKRGSWNGRKTIMTNIPKSMKGDFDGLGDQEMASKFLDFWKNKYEEKRAKYPFGSDNYSSMTIPSGKGNETPGSNETGVLGGVLSGAKSLGGNISSGASSMYNSITGTSGQSMIDGAKSIGASIGSGASSMYDSVTGNETMQNIGDGIGNAVDSTMEFGGGMLDSIMGEMGGFLGGDVGKMFEDSMATVMDVGKTAIGKSREGIGALNDWAMSGSREINSKLMDNVRRVNPNFDADIKDFNQNVVKDLTLGGVKAETRSMGDLMSSTWDETKRISGDIMGSDAVQSGKEMLGNGVDSVKSATSNMYDSLTGGDIGKSISSGVKSVSDSADNMFDKITNNNTLKGIGDNLKNTTGNITEKINGLVGGIKGGIENTWDKTRQIGDDIKSSTTGIFDNVKNSVMNNGKKISESFHEQKNKLGDTFKNITDRFSVNEGSIFDTKKFDSKVVQDKAEERVERSLASKKVASSPSIIPVSLPNAQLQSDAAKNGQDPSIVDKSILLLFNVVDQAFMKNAEAHAFGSEGFAVLNNQSIG